MPRQIKQKKAIPLLKSPFLIFRKVIGQMEIDEIIELSLTSKRMARVLGQTQSVVAVPPPSMTVEIENNDSYVFVTERGEPDGLIVFSWNIGNDYYGKPLTTRIEGINNIWRNHRTQTYNLEYYTRASGKAVNSPIKVIIERLLIVFPMMKVHLVKFDTAYTYFDTKKAFSDIKAIENLEIKGKLLTNNVREVLEKINVTKRLEMDCYVSIVGGFFNMTSLPSEFFECANATWMSNETFQKLNCKEVRLQKTKLTVKDVEQFLLQWKNSTEENKIKNWRIGIMESERELDYNMIGAEESDPPKNIHDGHEISRPIWFEKEIRRADGLVGSIRHASGFFYFIVD